MYADVYGHCPMCNRIHWRDKGCASKDGGEMTPRERAKEATWEAGCPDWGSDDQERLETAVEQAIIAAAKEAAEAEREKIARWADGAFGHSPNDVGAWIRSLEDRGHGYVATASTHSAAPAD